MNERTEIRGADPAPPPSCSGSPTRPGWTLKHERE